MRRSSITGSEESQFKDVVSSMVLFFPAGRQVSSPCRHEFDGETSVMMGIVVPSLVNLIGLSFNGRKMTRRSLFLQPVPPGGWAAECPLTDTSRTRNSIPSWIESNRLIEKKKRENDGWKRTCYTVA